MKTRKTYEKIDPVVLVKEAEALHESLLNYGILPRDVPAAILRLHAMHKQILKNDQRDYQIVELSEPYGHSDDAKALFAILNKVVNYSRLTDEDIHKVQAIDLPESHHIQSYLQFQQEMGAYLHFIRHYLITLRNELEENKIKVKDGGEIKEFLRFFKGGDQPHAVSKMKRILLDIDCEIIPNKIFKKYNAIADVLYGIKESDRHHLTEAFYRYQLEEIRSFSYIPPQLQHVEEYERAVEMQMVAKT
jgi:hypothetical protein